MRYKRRDMSTFADNLNKILREKGITKKALSGATGIAQSTISEWCNGRGPTLSAPVIKLANYLGVTLEFLVTGKNIEEQLLNDIIGENAFTQIHRGIYRITIDKKTKNKKDN